jgi:hypothetical protein
MTMGAGGDQLAQCDVWRLLVGGDRSSAQSSDAFLSATLWGLQW